ncbi:MAG: response regulator, partial [Anaerolineae bacterium]|nr:response regulator [Anaerolineae bacterium]
MTEAAYMYRLSPTSITAELPIKAEHKGPRAKVLVVEDDLHLMEGIQEILELDGYEVVTAPSGVEGLEILASGRPFPDLIISDIMMPKMSGYEFFEAVRSEANWLSIPFIFLTAKGEKSDIRLGKAMGADDYVTKPFGAEDLLVAVSSKLERNKQLQSVLSKQISDIKRQILTILNHEFRTPLTYVVAYSDMLTRDADRLSVKDLHDFLKGVGSGADRLQRLIENFILLVELETGEIASTYNWRKRVIRDVTPIVKAAVKYHQNLLEARQQKVAIEIAETLSPFVGDQEYLSAALIRLLDNAIKFSADHGQLEVKVYQDTDNRTTFEVHDYGRGIPEDELEMIFNMFYQINRPIYEDQGTGSGLAIVRGIA